MSAHTPQAKVLAIVPKITGGLSFLCSAYLVQHILRNPKKRKSTYHRLICGMSIGDCFGSFFGFFLSTWPFPKESGIYGAVGNIQTTTIAAFFNQAGNVMTPMYNGMLAIFYLLMLKYSWSNDKIKKVEYMLHGLPWLLGWGTAIAGLFLELYAPANWISWIAPYPSAAACLPNELGERPDTCQRGYNFNIYRWAFLYAEVWFTVVYVSIIMVMIYLKVRHLESDILTTTIVASSYAEEPVQSQQPLQDDDEPRETIIDVDEASDEIEEGRIISGETPAATTAEPREISTAEVAMAARAPSSSSAAAPHLATAGDKDKTDAEESDERQLMRNREKSRRVMHQGFYFVGAFFLTWVFGTITRLIQTISGQIYYPIIVLMTIFFPLQGFFNFMIYKRPEFLYARRRRKRLAEAKRRRRKMQRQQGRKSSSSGSRSAGGGGARGMNNYSNSSNDTNMSWFTSWWWLPDWTRGRSKGRGRNHHRGGSSGNTPDKATPSNLDPSQNTTSFHQRLQSPQSPSQFDGVGGSGVYNYSAARNRMNAFAANNQMNDDMLGDDYDEYNQYGDAESSIVLTPSELLALQTSSYFDENVTLARTESLIHTRTDGVGRSTIMEEEEYEEDEEEIVEA